MMCESRSKPQQRRRKVHIAYVIDNLRIGGAQVHLARLIGKMKRTFEIELIALGQASKSLVAQLPEGTKIISFKMASARNLTFWRDFVKLTAHFRATRPDIVHTYLNTANAFGLLAAKFGGVKHVITSRRDMGHFRSRRIAFAESVLCRLMAERVFCVCKAVAREARAKEHIPGKKLRVLYNGVDVERFRFREKFKNNKTINFAMVAAMDRPIKGHEDLIRAAAIALQKAGGKGKFYLVGDGPLRPSLEALVDELGLESSFCFLGERHDLDRLLLEQDVLVVPSHSEGISNAALEAMAMGLPVIGSAVDGNLEVVQEGVTGCLFKAKDVVALGQVFIKYVENPELIRVQGQNAAKRVKLLFSMNRMITSYLNQYKSVLA